MTISDRSDFKKIKKIKKTLSRTALLFHFLLTEGIFFVQGGLFLTKNEMFVAH